MSGGLVVVAYPRKEGSTFNKDYYLSTHIPLVEKHWKKHGLKSWVVSEFSPEGPYSYTVIMEFESPESFGAAAQDPNTAEIMGDVNNFSSEAPVLVHGGIIGRG